MNRIAHALASTALAVTGVAALPPFAAAQAVQDTAPLQLSGKGMFRFAAWSGPAIRVFYQLPDAVTEKTPILFVIHGVQRDAENYRDEWARYAKDRGFIVIAPEFSEADFPGNNSFSSGGMFTEDDVLQPRKRWAFSVIDPIFDAVRAATGSRVPRYILFGHSGGAQFVQRMALFMPQAHIQRAIAANAGWYTMPDFDTPFPYGLKGAPIDEAGLKAALARPLWILLGSRDTNPNSANLRRTPEAMRQGPHRLARGNSYYAAAKAAAEKLGTPFAWQRRYVNGVAHDDAGMAAAAVVLVQ